MMTFVDGAPAESRSKRGITIGQLAAYAGVTIKAVRHYHRRGLLEEPRRDVSGYRRYNAQHAITLVKIKTLADAGVPLGRIKELLAANVDGFTAAVTDIDHKLKQRVDELVRTRERLADLRSGDRLFVSGQVADYLDRLRKLGVSQRTIELERDGWILLHSASPDEAARLIIDKCEVIEDPEFQTLYLEHDAAFGWSPGDPRLEALAERTAGWMARRPRAPSMDPTIHWLTASLRNASPAWNALTRIAEDQRRG
ncbi:MAG TPA: MerR family transcriptional regulator [Chloroflexota bacterium]|jgi:DNA-binding transcriptional MerR regulator